VAVTRQEQRSGRWRKAAWALGGVVGLALLLWWGELVIFPYSIGPKQPLPFSHRVHAGDREISCLFCHAYADQSQDAGMPEVSKCLLCHNVIIRDFSPVQELRSYAERQEPVPWERVYQVPDYVRFNHQVHLTASVDCGECHGDVKKMDRIAIPQPIVMGFCLDCHRKKQASVDCTACHY
jgi:hypothetical protein